jgi:hypothetical protein
MNPYLASPAENQFFRGSHRVSARIAEHGDHRKHFDYSKYKDESKS